MTSEGNLLSVPALVGEWQGFFNMPSHIDMDGHTTAEYSQTFGNPFMEHWVEILLRSKYRMRSHDL